MAGNKTLELSIKIAGKVDKSLINAINAAQSNVSSLSTTLSKVGTVGLAAMGAMATGTVVALAKCTDAAKDFEGQMSSVVKYVDGLADANGKISDTMAGNGTTYAENYAAMSEAILELSTQIPMTAEELTQLAAAAGQSGKGISDLIQYDNNGKLAGFLKDVAMMGTAMDISAEQAGDWAAKWEKAFNIDHEQVMILSDQINYLGANSATTAAEIAQVVNEAAGLGQVAGMDVASTAALADAMLAMGVDTSKAATSISRMYTNMSLGASATDAQKAMWRSLGFTAEGVAKSMQDNATGTMIDVFNAIGNMDAEKQVAALKTLFGQWAIQGAAKLTGNLEAYQNALAMVADPDLYKGSMEREFIIKASTSEAIDSMMANAFQAMQIDVGTAFLPAKKEISVALIDFMNQLRSMPELGEIAQQLATLFSRGVTWAADALENALPTIQKALDYLVNNGPQVLSFLGKLAAVFAAMKFAPGIETLVRGAGSMVFGSRTGGATNTGSGGIVGMLGSLFRGGQNAASGAAGMAGNAASWISSFIGATRNNMALTGRTGIMGFLGTAASALTSGLGNTGIGQYLGGIGSSLGNFLNVSGIGGAARGALGATGQILSGISQATGLTDLVNSAKKNIAVAGASAIINVNALAQKMASSTPVQAVTGLARNVIYSAPVQGIASMASGAAGWLGSTIPAGLNVMGSVLGPMWGPMASGFGSLLTGALPIVGVISGIIAVVSLLNDKFNILDTVFNRLFGEEGPEKLTQFRDFISGIFSGNVISHAMANLRESIFGIFDDDEGWTGGLLSNLLPADTISMMVNAFNRLTPIIQSVMGVVGQLVTFANTTVKPIILDIFNFITQTVVPIILQTFTAAAPMISGIISNLGSAIMTVAQIIGTAIQAVLPIVEGLISVIMTVGQVAIPAALAYIEQFSAGIQEIVSAIQAIFQGIIDFITGVFTGNWEQAWQGILDIFGSIFETLGALFKTPINAVISLINKAISGVNNLGLDIPDWVPIIGGQKFGIDIPEIPLLAKGGFTNGPSIAGEAGTEAVISFQRSARASNIATWAKAGQMLGVSNRPARLETFDTDDGGPGWPPNNGGGPVTITYAPTIIVQSNASREDIDAALRDDKARFDAWYEEKRRNERRARW